MKLDAHGGDLLAMASVSKRDPASLLDFQPPFRRGFHEEAVAAVRHAVEMQPAGYEDPDEAPDDPAELGGQEQGR